jgi:pyrrolidone-carboxylate peptidase
MNKEEILINLEYWASSLENPTYNPLETGFRHTPLSKDEIIDRYKQECAMTRHAILRVMEIINEKGIQ